MNYRKLLVLSLHSVFFALINRSYSCSRIRQKCSQVEIAQPGLTIGKLTQPQNDTKENIAKSI